MVKKTEDIVFKDVTEEEVGIFLRKVHIKSKKKILNPTEIRFIDATVLIADVILELDDIILIIEFQSTIVDIYDKNRFLAYVAMVNFKKKTDKPVKLFVISTAERTKKITHIIEDTIKFTFDIYSMMDEDGDIIINNIETKIKNNEEITDEELIDLSLTPVMGSKNTQEQQIKKSVDLILSIDLDNNKVKNLVKSVAYLLADKFLEDGEEKNVICDALGGKMSAVYDYGQRQKEEGIKETSEKMAIYMIKKGESDEEIHKETDLTLEKIKQLRKNIKIQE